MIVKFALYVHETLVVPFCACAVSLNSAWLGETGRSPNRRFQFHKRLNFSSAFTTKRFPSPRGCASAIQIVRSENQSLTRSPSSTLLCYACPLYFPITSHKCEYQL